MRRGCSSGLQRICAIAISARGLVVPQAARSHGIRQFNGKSDVAGMQPESYLGANGPGPKGTLDSHAKKNYWVEKLDTYRENKFSTWQLDSSNAFSVFVAVVAIPAMLYYLRSVEREDTMSRNGKKEAFALIEARQKQIE